MLHEGSAHPHSFLPPLPELPKVGCPHGLLGKFPLSLTAATLTQRFWGVGLGEQRL